MDETDVADLSKSLLSSFPFCSRLYQCLLFASRYPIPFVVNVPPRVGRPAVLRPQDLETRYWIPAPYSGFCRSVRDIAATTFTTDHVSFGNKAEPLDVTYTVFYLDQIFGRPSNMCTSELGLKSPWFGNILIVQTNQFGEVTDFDEDHEIQARDVVIGAIKHGLMS